MSHQEQIPKPDEKPSPEGSQTASALTIVEEKVDVKNQTPISQLEFPDGGLRAWIVVFGASFAAYATFGFVNSWGVFQAYYQETLLHNQSPSTIAWIGSVQYCLVFLPGLIIGRLFDLGYFRSLFIVSGLCLVVATFLAAECTEYWQFLLAQGIMAGIGCGGLFTCCNSVLAHWFKKRRGSALGYMAIGSALAGVTVPIIVQNLLPRVGFRWTMRTLGFIFLFTVIVCNLTMRTRLPPTNVRGGLFNFAVFKNIPFTLFTLSALTAFLGLFTVITYISVSAAQVPAITPELAFYFVAIANASSLFGRWSAGIVCDIIGPLNVIAPAVLISGVATYAWPFARSTASLLIITIIYGFCIGAFVCLLPRPIMSFGGEGDVGRRVGMYLTVIAFGTLAGPPISGAINRRTDGFELVGVYAGTMQILSFFLMLICRHLVLGKFIGKA